MCGIVYAKDFRGQNVADRVVRRYKAQRSRGTEGFGYYIPKLNRLTHNPDENKLINNLLRQDASEVLFHHRFPTSTQNVQSACHPFSTKWDGFKHNYVMVHNGYLSNDFELLDAHEALGIRYVSEQANGQFNDSEALLYDLALYLDGQQSELKSKGAIAFVVIERDETGEAIKLHWGRNTSPLKFKFKKNKYMTLASEGKGEDVKPHMLHTYEYATGEFTSSDLKIPGYEYQHVAKTFNFDDFDEDKNNYYNPGATTLSLSDIDVEYSYYDHQGDHYWASTKATVADTLCHLKGEPCPKATASSEASSENRTERVADYVDLALYKTAFETHDAIDLVELELAEAKTKYGQLKSSLVAIENEQERVQEFLDVSVDMDLLDEDIKVYKRALTHLVAQAEYEDSTFAQSQLMLESGVSGDRP